MTEELVNLTVADGVAIVELHRPERKNSLTGPLLDRLAEQVHAASADASVQVVVLCGAGGAFCSGLDLKEYRADPPPPWLANAAASLRAAHTALGQCGVPIVVAMERYAINGGAAFALAADLLVVGETSWLQVGEVLMDMAAPMNLAWLVPRHPVSTIMRLVIPGERVLGPQLAAMNIAHEVVDDDQVRDRAIELATQIAAYPQGAPRSMKQSVLRVADAAQTADWFEHVWTVAQKT